MLVVGYELERANVVAPHGISEDVVTMNSKISMRLDDEEMEITLVYPEDENERSGKLSILSDIGAAILGCRDGDAIDCLVANRTRSLRLDGMIYQPEAAGDFDL